MYEYNCRQCSIRMQCIKQSHNASSIKNMMLHAFENRTDTLATWGRLQKNCLFVKAKQDDALADNQASALSKRLREARTMKIEKNPSDATEFVAKSSGIVGIEELDRRHARRSRESSKNIEGVTQLKPEKMANLTSLLSFETSDISATHWLTIEGTWRHIALPVDGSIVLGRFDPNIGIPPDIDLTFEDGQSQNVSRRHAALVGESGTHTLEDLGSISGVYINNKKISFGLSHPLQNGDRIMIGNIHLIYDRVPVPVLSAFNQRWVRHTLTVTATGHKVELIPDKSVTMGRADRHINYVPEIDLQRYGQIARRVSRRHAQITWRAGKPFVEDMGSGFGTKLRGMLLPIGKTMPLFPGDHIWLAGCVVAYDIETVVAADEGTTDLVSVFQVPQLESVRPPA